MTDMRRDLVLVVDPDKRTARLLKDSFSELNLDIAAALTGEEGRRAANELKPNAIVAEVELPDISGFDLCKQLSALKRLSTIPILFFTTRDAEIDVVVGFEIGATDYVSKSISARELALRIHAILKRTESTISSVQRIGKVVLDFEQSTASQNGVRLLLSPMEFQILAALAKADGRVMNRAEIIRVAWPTESDVMGRTVDAHIKSLRAKISNAGFNIVTVRGIGYCLRADASSTPQEMSESGKPINNSHQDEQRLILMERNVKCRKESGL